MQPQPSSFIDHDLLIVLDTKMNQLSLDLKNLGDGTTAKIANHELRLTAVEQAQHDAKITWRLMLALAIGMGSLITFILTVTLGVLNIIHFH